MDGKAGQWQGFDGDTIARRLRARRGEIERAFARGCAAPAPNGGEGAAYRAGLQSAVTEFIGYTIECITNGEDDSTPVPSAAIAQARRAARDGVPLDTVLVRFIAGHALLNEFILSEAADLTSESLRQVQALQGSMLLRFASLLAQAYKEELKRGVSSVEQRRAALVKRLISGAPVDERALAYPLDAWHIGLVVTGLRAMDAARVLAESLGGALLAVPRGSETVWAWIGNHQKVSVDRVESALERSRNLNARFAVGEPGKGVEGWRSSHFEAQAALAVATRMPQAVTCFSSVALEAIALQAPDLARSLHAAYLAPLATRNRGGEILRQTLRAYFAAGRNASSTAIALKVTRRTVENRLRAIEDELGRPLRVCSAELEVALRLETLTELDFAMPRSG